ncbi:MAG: patatin-like phospholipase family protein [Actinophytocola sp.]|uniref:patatin-like phospholipase family protein n=1 Tax=Actinophytocola sp. TaxID=1872138 RepID=UPI003D6AAFD4
MTRRALVLGGGGITGIAWEWGILSGLKAAGVDLGDADLVVGTSAGSVVGAQVATGLDFADRYEAQLVPPDGEIAGVLGPGLLLRYGLAIVSGPRAPRKVRVRIGKLAERASTVPEAERVAVIESRLPVHEWPERELRITAVDVETGEFRAFDRAAGVSLVLAVAASCAVPGVWPPVTIDGRRYMDGGVRSGANADLAAGYDRVVVLAPLPRGVGTGAAAQVEALRASARAELVTPDRDALKAFGRNVLDPAKRAAAARAGLAQSASVIERVRSVWR